MYILPDPSTKKFTQLNASDLLGNLFYTKCLIFDNDGYVKLAPRCVRIASEQDTGDFDIPISFGRFGQGNFHIVTADKAFDTNITRNSSIMVSEDVTTNAPELDFDSTGIWFNNLWHAVDNRAHLMYKDSFGWHDTGIVLTVGVTHAMEVFRNKNLLAVSNGNSVQLYDTSYVLQTDDILGIPVDFEIIGMSYVGGQMGIITILSSAVSGQNQEAFFFVWNGVGVSTTDGQTIPCGSDGIMAISPYQSGWVIVTRGGQLLSWNGGGFAEIAKFQFYNSEIEWSSPSTKSMFGNSIQVDGDKLYINISSNLGQFGGKDEHYMSNYPGGVLCYDSNVGLYHRYSPSVSKASMVTVTNTNIDTTGNIFSKTSGTLPATGNPVIYTYNRSTQIGGLKVGTIYYIINIDGTHFKLAFTKDDAIAGNAIDITSIGDVTNYFMMVDIVDYGISLSPGRTAGVALFGSNDLMYEKLIFGGDYSDVDSNDTDFGTLCMPVPGLKNIGYFVTTKISSQEVEQMFKNIILKCGRLDTDDYLMIKYKNEDIAGIPVTTPQKDSLRCQWTDTKTFITSADLSEATAYLSTDEAELECEFTAGAAAGQMSQIASIQGSAGVYTVLLEDELEGAVAGRFSDILIENWKVLKTTEDDVQMTSSNTNGHSQFSIDKNSKWIMFKVILGGSGVLFEESILNNTVQMPGEGI